MSPEGQILFNILLTVVSGGLGGALIYGFINWVQNFVKLTGAQQFGLAVLIALVLPAAAYLLTVALGFQQFDISALILSIFTGYVSSQGLAYKQRQGEDAAQTAQGGGGD